MKKKMNFAAAILLSSVMAVSAGFAAIPAAAATLTINRDSTWNQPNATVKNATYTYYKIFERGCLHSQRCS